MSFSRKVRRNIRNQQRKAIGKYLQARQRELDAQRRVEVRQVVYSTSPGKNWTVTGA